MKLTALAVVILALGTVAGLALRGTVTEAAPPFATTQFVDDSIEAFNQTVVQPIAAAVTQLQGDVSDLDQRVTALESADGTSVVTDRALLQHSGGGGKLDLVDTDDGSFIATYSGVSFAGSNCDDTRAFLRDSSSQQFTLIDTSDGQVLGVYDTNITPISTAVATFGCRNLQWLNSGLQVVKNRAVVSWSDGTGLAEEASLLDTDNGQVIASYAGLVSGDHFWNCVGSTLLVSRVGMVDTVTGAVITPFNGAFSGLTFVCR